MRHLNYRPAHNFKRVMAYLIDILPIQMGLYFVCMSYFGISPIMSSHAPPSVATSTLIARTVITCGTLLIWILYCIAGEMSPWRGTLGKKIMGISVKSTTGRRLTFGQILGRNMSKILSAIPCYLGFIAALFVHGNRAWHDSLSKTAVVERS